MNNPIQEGAIHMSEQNFGRRWEQEGLITMSWNSSTSVDQQDESVLFTMTFKAKKAGRLSESFRLGSQRTIAESYEGKGELGNLSIRFTGKYGEEIIGHSKLYQNYPNPFDQSRSFGTVIGINLAQQGRGVLKITDITGRTIKRIEREWNKGYQEIWLDRKDLSATGVLYYSFESESLLAVKKMIVID